MLLSVAEHKVLSLELMVLVTDGASRFGVTWVVWAAGMSMTRHKHTFSSVLNASSLPWSDDTHQSLTMVADNPR